MMDFVQSLGLPHLLMLAGALLVIAGCIGLAIGGRKAAEIDDEPVTSPERLSKSPPPDLLGSRRKAAGKQPDFPDE